MPTLPAEAFRFCGPTYLAQSSVLDCERSINLYPENAPPSAKSPVALWGTPGLTSFVTLANTPIRALWAGTWAGVQGRLFAVGGARPYEIFGGATTQIYGAMSGATGPCVFKENGTQLLVLDSASSKIYNLDGTLFTSTAVFNATALEYLDGFYVAIATGASLSNPALTNQVNVSNSLDGSTWNALNFIIKTGSQDQITQLAVINGQLWVFGQKTIEPWYNAGNPGFPFQRIQGATINQGLLAKWTVAKTNNALIWLGADDRGYAVVYKSQGLLPVRISNHAIEYLIGTFADISSATAYIYQEAGHTFYVLNFSNGTLVYDLTTEMWHERAYLNAGTLERARPNCFASVNNFPAAGQNTNYVGDYSTGNIYSQSISIAADNGSTIRRIRTAPHIANHNQWIKYRRFELDADIGTATPVLDYSNDGGRNFQVGTLAYAMTKSTASTPGGFGQYYAMQLGRSRDRVFRVTINDSTNLIKLVNAYVDANPGTER